MTARVAKLTQEIERLTEAIATGAAPASVVQAISSREKERRDLQAKLEHLEGLQLEADDFDIAEFIEEVKEVLDETREALEADVVKGRRTLQRLLTTPITVTPSADGGFDFSAQASWAGWDFETRAIVMKKEELTGTIERGPRRFKGTCPRGDSNTRHAV